MPPLAADERELVALGRISGLFGVRGWVKVFSHTEPREQIVRYSPWLIRLGGEWRAMKVVSGKAHGKGVVVRLESVEDRDAAARLIDAEIAVPRDQLPALEPGDYYWADLEGLAVVTTEGVGLGKVDHLFETGANDVLVVKGERERLIPYTDDAVVAVDLEAGCIEVDWDPEF
ncbi:ribosome maturation factor RimM [Endothiovibrio diazotrophicus]